MAKSQWAEQLRAALRQQGLPQAYVDRLVSELSDHAADILEENSMNAERVLTLRLGAPDQLAKVATFQFRRRMFAGRHPFLTFVVGPLFVVLGLLVLTFVAIAAGLLLIDVVLGGMLSANEHLNGPPSNQELAMMHAINFSLRIVPFALSAWFFARLGRRSGQRTWGIVACSLVAIIAFFFVATIRGAAAEQPASWMMGLGCRFTADQLIQVVVPAAIAAFLIWQRPVAD